MVIDEEESHITVACHYAFPDIFAPSKSLEANIWAPKDYIMTLIAFSPLDVITTKYAPATMTPIRCSCFAFSCIIIYLKMQRVNIYF